MVKPRLHGTLGSDLEALNKYNTENKIKITTTVAIVPVVYEQIGETKSVRSKDQMFKCVFITGNLNYFTT